MPSLGETTAMLARLRRAAPARSAGSGLMARGEAFGANPGHLAMLSYTPRALAPRSPLVVVLHGCTQTAEAYADNAGWLALADRFGFVVLAPEQSAANNPNRCFSWFSPGDVRRGGGEAASIASMTAHVIAEYDLDPERVFITGLSAGGAMAAAMLASYPDLFTAGAVIAGLPYGVAGNVQDALRVMSRADGRPAHVLGSLVPKPHDGAGLPRLSIWHGDSDFTVQVANAHDLAHQWSAAHGLPSTPERVEPQAFGTRSIWRSASGDVQVELNQVRGLGHGTPLSTRGEDGLGRAAPYMLEAGVSSSLEIARFWNIDGAAAMERGPPTVDDGEPALTQEPSNLNVGDLGHSVMRSISAVPTTVQDTIAKALRAAGLLK